MTEQLNFMVIMGYLPLQQYKVKIQPLVKQIPTSRTNDFRILMPILLSFKPLSILLFQKFN